MILYTQYCPMGVFFCVSQLLVPFSSSCFHLQISEMVLFVTTAIAFYWAMVIASSVSTMNFLFFCVSSLLSLSRYRWFNLVLGSSSSFLIVPARFKQFQLLPGGSRQFQLVPDCSSLSQLIPRFSMYALSREVLYLRSFISSKTSLVTSIPEHFSLTLFQAVCYLR